MEVVSGVLDSLMAEGEGAVMDAGIDDGAGHVDDGQQTDDTNGGDGQQQTDDKDGKEETAGNNRNNPDAIRKHLASLRANPETADLGKEVTNRLGKARAYEETFATVKEAREVKALIDSVGGREQITSAIESRAAMQRVDSMLESGDPAILEDIFKQAPEGMLKLMPAILDRVAQQNPQAYQAAITPHAVGLLDQQGLPGAINALVDAFDADNKEGMKQILSRIVQWYSGLKQGVTAKKTVDPAQEKFQKEKTEWETQKQQEAIKTTFNANLEYSAKKIDGALVPDIKRLGLGKGNVARLRQDVWKEIETRRNNDGVFKSTVNQKFDGKTPKDDAVTFLNGFTDRSVKEAIATVLARDEWKEFETRTPAAKIDPTAPKKAAGGGGGGGKESATQSGALRVTAPPDRKDINYDDPRTDVLNGLAVRKSDKRLVQWR